MITKEELTKIIEKEISYDANECQAEIKCQHCSEIVRRQVLDHWIDHKSTLINSITHALGLRIDEQIERILDDVYVTGDAETDSKEIADKIFKELIL